jgi:hypothetical protein
MDDRPESSYNRAMIEETLRPELDPRRQKAVVELTGLIKAHYPSATFAVRPGIEGPDAT